MASSIDLKFDRSKQTVSDYVLRTADFGGSANIKEIAKLEGNTSCADCGVEDNCWVSTGVGVFVCIDCAGNHKSIGGKFAKVSSMKQDSKTMFTLENIQLLESMGNIKANLTYEARCPSYYLRACEIQESEIIRENQIRAKYLRKDFLIEKYVEDYEKEKKSEEKQIDTIEAKPDTSSTEYPFHSMPQEPFEGYLTMIVKKKNKKQVQCCLQVDSFSIYKSLADSKPESIINVSNKKISVKDTTRKGTLYILFEIIDRETNETWSFEVMDMNKIFGWIHSLRRASVYYAVTRNKPNSLDGTQCTNVSDEVKNNAEQKGFLKKNGSKRYFILTESSIFYFKKQSKTQPDGTILMMNASCKICDAERSGKKKNVFLVQTRTKNYILQANDEAEMNEWIKKIQAAIDKYTVRERADFNQLKYIM